MGAILLQRAGGRRVNATDAAWAEALAMIERDVAELERALATGGNVTTPPWSAPKGIGPLPAHLARRANDLLRRIDNTSAAVRDSREATVAEQQRNRRRRSAATAYRVTA